MNKINEIYKQLLKKHKPQGWWPLTEKGSFIPVHKGKLPKTDNQMFEIMVGALLTQNTNWKNVEKAFANLNKAKLVDIKKMRNIPKQKLAKLIRPSGYFNQKAERLKIMAEFLTKNPVKELKKLKTSSLRKSFLSVKGIGPETGDSILLYAFQRPVFVIDAYTKRFCLKQKLCTEKTNYDELQELFHKTLPKKVKLYKEYHALIVAEGKIRQKKRI